MSHATSSKAAAAYLIEPMTAPEPSAETGPGTHFRSTYDPTNPNTTSPPLASKNPFRKSSVASPPSEQKGASVSSRARSANSPKERFPDYRAEAFGSHASAPRRSSGSNIRPPPPHEDGTSPQHSSRETRHRRRTSSLSARYPGDKSHEPLEIIRKDSKKAHRSPHLRKKHQPGPDIIDRLDPVIGGRPYHHEGPYDAALLSRNTRPEYSPVAALRDSNQEALKATPPENIKDALERHRPLDGVAAVPPGLPDRFGRTYNYEEGADLLHEDAGDGPGYKRWAGKDYAPDDLKGKSEPSFSLDKAMKAHKINDEGIEMTNTSRGSRSGKASGPSSPRDPLMISGNDGKSFDSDVAHTHGADTGREQGNSLRAGLKKRIGSLRKKRADS